MNLLSRILQTCREFPHETAIKNDVISITYQELWQAANSLSNELIARDLKDSCISIYLDNKPDTIIAMLGVLLSDNYYLCLPKLTDLEEVTNHIDIALCITNDDTQTRSGVTNIPFPTNQNETTSDHWWEEKLLNHKWCCVYCTSGSTGQMKYVLHDYASIEEDTYRQVEENFITPNDRIDFLYTASFSSALASIFPALIAGAAIITFDFSRGSIVDLAAFWTNHKITFTTMVPSSFRGLCMAFGNKLKNYNGSLRYVSIGGEIVLDEDIVMFKQLFHDSTILQIVYASTETRTATQIKIDKKSEYKEPNVGVAVRSKTVYVVENKLLEDQTTISGEVIVQSKFISVGYFQNRKLHRHPISLGERVYRTGDLGHFTEEGNLVITGRTNALIKVNGVRLDLSILEHELCNITKKNCIVIARKDHHYLDYLVAFIETNEDVDINRVRQKVNDKLFLPTSPREYVLISQLPLNVNQKVDREALKKHEILNTNRKISPAEFQDDHVLQTITSCWQNLLNLNHFSIHDDFFNDLGGSSLISMIAINEIEQTLKIELDSYDIFNTRTAFELSKSIRYKTEYPKIELLNDSSENKPFLFFLQMGSKNDYDCLIDDHLLDCFNIGYLRYNLFSLLKGKTSQDLQDELVETLRPYKELILVGYSFSGFLGAKLARNLEGKCFNVLLDSPFYESRGKNITQVSFVGKCRYLLETLFSEPLSNTSKLLFDFVNKRVNKDNTNIIDHLSDCVVTFVEELGPVIQVKNLLYLYSRHSLDTTKKDLSMWKGTVVNHFSLKKMPGGHMVALSEQFGTDTSSEIIEFYNKTSC